ncbi:DedA family protein [Candidatus Curtissbacteria bacterium]|nr:DedA family protein [Candidatus Curtissbacteria bacterium]
MNLGGYVLLALLAILAPSPIPIPLDGIILGLIATGFNPVIVISIALIGDIIGTVLIYAIGRKGRSLLSKYRKTRKRKDYIIAENLFKRYGKFALLFSGVPFVGDALIFLAGFYRIPTNTFLIWFILGKILWYSLVIVPIVVIGKPLLPIKP